MQSERAIARATPRVTRRRSTKTSIFRAIPLVLTLCYFCMAFLTVFAQSSIGERVTKTETVVEQLGKQTETATVDLKALAITVNTMATEFKAQRETDKQKWDYIIELSKIIVGGLLLQLAFGAWSVYKKVSLWTVQRKGSDA